jgi:hypothetical protein
VLVNEIKELVLDDTTPTDEVEMSVLLVLVTSLRGTEEVLVKAGTVELLVELAELTTLLVLVLEAALLM